MNGIHDLGGMDGMGSVEREEDEPVFHEEWERRVFGMRLALGAYTSDESRRTIERMDPAYYLDSPYYEHWLVAMEALLTEKGVLDPDELRDRIKSLGTAEEFDEGLPERRNPEAAAAVREEIETESSLRREPVPPSFEAGDEVVVENIHPEGHTRCPKFVRRARGTVVRVDGTFPLPDTNAHGEGENPEPVYHVRFDAAELWGDDAEENAPVYVDLWESYLGSP